MKPETFVTLRPLIWDKLAKLHWCPGSSVMTTWAEKTSTEMSFNPLTVRNFSHGTLLPERFATRNYEEKLITKC